MRLFFTRSRRDDHDELQPSRDSPDGKNNSRPLEDNNTQSTIKSRNERTALSGHGHSSLEQQPLLGRETSRQSYASTSSPQRLKNGSHLDINAPESAHVRARSRSKRRKTRIRTSIYADPPRSYTRAILSYTLTVTLSSTIFLALFGVLKIIAWPHSLHPSPLREFLVGAASWTVAYALRVPILYIFTLGNNYVNAFTSTVSTFVQVSGQEAIRLAVLVLLQIHLDRPPIQDTQAHSGLTLSRSRLDGEDTGAPPDWAPLPDVWHTAFTQVWWLALGWATIDVAVGVVQGYEQLALYRDVLKGYERKRSHVQGSPSPPPRLKGRRSSRPTENFARSASNLPDHQHEGQAHEHEEEGVLNGGRVPIPPHLSPQNGDYQQQQQYQPIRQPSHVLYTATPLQMQSSELVLSGEANVVAASPLDLEAELSSLITRKQRAELEGVYGSPLPRIPIFLIALQRLDSILLSIGLTLLVSSAYLRALYLPPEEPSTPVASALSLSSLVPLAEGLSASVVETLKRRMDGGSVRYKQDWEVDWAEIKHTTVPVFVAVVLIHFALSILWIEALPRIGVHTASYVGLLVSLTAFFAGLGYWSALI
ncbi:hypothetical protein FRC19_006989 [Serendipita sp. 401]|nr:hypothetical protein FRC19_006989 [Serendipita sp. 401]KAG9057235.1 hypothetical protein FS842_008160 [Serendipita sp. 407]